MNDSPDSLPVANDAVLESDERLKARLFALVDEIMDRTDECRQNSLYAVDGVYDGMKSAYMDALQYFRECFALEYSFQSKIESFLRTGARSCPPVGHTENLAEMWDAGTTEFYLSMTIAHICECLKNVEQDWAGCGGQLIEGMAVAYRETLEIIFKHFGEMESLKERLRQPPETRFAQ